MAESPLSIRVAEEVKELFNEVAKSEDFDNKGELLKRLILTYQSEKAKSNTPMLKAAIQSVGTLTNQLMDLLVGLSASMSLEEERISKDRNELIASHNASTDSMLNRIKTLEAEKAQAIDKANNLEAELSKTRKELMEAQKTIALQSQIEQLTAVLSSNGIGVNIDAKKPKESKA